MNRTFKKGMALLVAVVMCICLLPLAASAIEVVDAPVVGTAYKFGMIQENVSSTDVYYLTGAMNGYYMDTTTDASASIDVYLEQTSGGYYLYTMKGSAKTYINMVVSGTHVNGAYESSASTVYRYDEESKTLIADVNGKDYWFGTRNDKTYTTVGPCATSFNGFYCCFYGEAVVECQHTNTTVEGAVAATCTTDGHSGKTVCTACGETVNAGEVIAAVGHNFVDGVCSACGETETVESGNKADFNTIVTEKPTGDSSYSKTHTTANGWIIENSAVQCGGATVMNPQFPVIGADNTFKAVCLNGKVTAPGKVTSPTLSGGISKLTMSYTKMFTDTALSVTITITDLATGATYTDTVAREVDKNEDKYVVWDYEWVLETPITGDFTIEVVNACPTAASGNKDRFTILDLAWEAAAVECQHTNTTVEGAVDATCTADGHTGKTVCADCGETVSEGEVIGALGHADADENGLCDACGTQCGESVPPTGDNSILFMVAILLVSAAAIVLMSKKRQMA